MPKDFQRESVAMTQGEYVKFLRAAYKLNPRYGLFFDVIAATGLPISHIERLTPQELDRDMRKVRGVTIPASTFKRLIAYVDGLKVKHGDYIFGRPVTPQSVFNSFRRISHIAGLSHKLTPVSLRCIRFEPTFV